MNVTIAAVGKLRRSPLQEVFDDYAKRLPWRLTVKEIAPSRESTPEARREREAGLLLARAPAGAVVVLLDAGGRDMASAAFAKLIAGWQQDGRPVAFLIGGPDGHGTAARRAADATIAFGKATWPHLLVRAMLAEQLYRAASILEGHPYHRA